MLPYFLDKDNAHSAISVAYGLIFPDRGQPSEDIITRVFKELKRLVPRHSDFLSTSKQGRMEMIKLIFKSGAADDYVMAFAHKEYGSNFMLMPTIDQIDCRMKAYNMDYDKFEIAFDNGECPSQVFK